MNHYPHHIGDYLKDTAHLTIMEDGAYRRLLDLYYQREQPLPADKNQLYRLARASSSAEKKSINTILDEFFSLTPDGYRQARCDEEISIYQQKSDDADGKKENERERQKRHRARRSELFAILKTFDVVPPYNAKTTELESLLSQYQSRHVTRDSTSPETRTATAIPIANNQEPSLYGVTVTDEHPPDPSPQASDDSPYGDPTKAGLLAKLLRSLGVQVAPSNPSFQQWVAEGLDSEEALAGVDIARGTKPAPEPIPWAYLAKVLATQRKAGVSTIPTDGDDYGGLA